MSRPLDGHQVLVGVRDELAAVIRTARRRRGGVLPGIIRLDRAFTAGALARALSSKYSVIHVASHFVFSAAREASSYLLLGDGSKLTLAEFGDLRFDAIDLVVLSACNTAVGGGHSQNGREIEGLGALVRHQGANQVLATLWPVADMTTASLMHAFYRNRYRAKLAPAEALRRAQLDLLRGAIDLPRTRQCAPWSIPTRIRPRRRPTPAIRFIGRPTFSWARFQNRQPDGLCLLRIQCSFITQVLHHQSSAKRKKGGGALIGAMWSHRSRATPAGVAACKRSGRARLPALRRGTCGSERTPPLSSRRTSWDVAKRRALPASACPSPATLSQTGHHAGRAFSQSRPGTECKSARGNRSRSDFRSALEEASLPSEILKTNVTEVVTSVKDRPMSQDTYYALLLRVLKNT